MAPQSAQPNASDPSAHQARRLTDAGVDADAIQGSAQAAQAAQAFAELNTKHKPPEGWPRDIKYTNQLLWNEVST